MIPGIALFDIASGAAAGVVVIFLRVAAMCVVLPGFGDQTLSVRVKLIAALMLTTAVAPAVLPILPPLEPDLPLLAKALATETIAGLFLGIMLRAFIHAIQIAGAIAAQSTSLSQLMGQAGADPLPAMGHVLAIGALALLMMTGFHVKAATYIVVSYSLLPPLDFPSASAVADAGRLRVAQTFTLAFTLASPFVILSVLYNLTLGVINKAMPQLMVAFVGAPVITFGSIALLFVSAPFMLLTWSNAVDAFLAAPLR